MPDSNDKTKGCGNKRPENQDKKKCIQHDDPASLARWRKRAPPAGMICQGQHGNKFSCNGNRIRERRLGVKGLFPAKQAAGQAEKAKKRQSQLVALPGARGSKWRGVQDMASRNAVIPFVTDLSS